MDQLSKTTSHFKRDSNTVQYGKFRTRRGSWFINNLLQARLPQHPRLLQVRKLSIQITIQQPRQVKVWIDKHGKSRSFLKHQKSCCMNQPKSQNKGKMRITNRYGETRIQTYWNGCKEFRENLVDDRVPEHRDSHASSFRELS